MKLKNPQYESAFTPKCIDNQVNLSYRDIVTVNLI